MQLDRPHYAQFLQKQFGITITAGQYAIALAGNPNVGKSSLFNALTGLHQHTGNWAGKTVDNAQGIFSYQDQSFLLIDLPGTYSLLAHTVEERIARDFLCFGCPDAVLVVLDATCLERNLNLALQVTEITNNVIVCINLIDEARKKKLEIDISCLEHELGVPVVCTSARTGEGLATLKENLYLIASGIKKPCPKQILYSEKLETAITELLPDVQRLVDHKWNPRWMALRLLEGDRAFLDSMQQYLPLYFPASLREDAIL